MYSYCRVRFVDDGSELDVVIKATEDFDDKDEEIFFYGITPEEITEAIEDGTIIEREWQILELYEVTDCLE